jgi:hypothetical protein
MGRAIFVAFSMFAVAGCLATPEPIRPIQPLPTDAGAMSYREVMIRARTLASTANEAFYIDHWSDVEKAALSLEETAQYLPRAAEIPPTRKVSLDARSQELIRQSQELRAAAKAKNEKMTNEAMQKINLLVRELRPE